jgi:predicted ABC-type ATPase
VPSLVVIAGPNGAGKSTVAPFLVREALGIDEFVNADQIAQGLSGFDPESAAFRAGRIMLQQIHELANTGASFAFESTLASRSFAPFIADLARRGYTFHLAYVWIAGVRRAKQRVARRVAEGGHNVAPNVIARRYRRSLRNFFDLYQDLADEWRFYDNSHKPPRLIAAGGKTASTAIFDKPIWRRIREEYRGT